MKRTVKGVFVLTRDELAAVRALRSRKARGTSLMESDMKAIGVPESWYMSFRKYFYSCAFYSAWSEEDINRLRLMYERGMKVKDIADYFHTSPNVINNKITAYRAAGLNIRRVKKVGGSDKPATVKVGRNADHLSDRDRLCINRWFESLKLDEKKFVIKGSGESVRKVLARPYCGEKSAVVTWWNGLGWSDRLSLFHKYRSKVNGLESRLMLADLKSVYVLGGCGTEQFAEVRKSYSI